MNKKSQPLLGDEIKIALNHLRSEQHKNAERNYILCLLTINTGCRIGDVLNMTLNDIKNGFIIQQKTGKPQYFTKQKILIEIITQYCEQRNIGYNDKIFISQKNNVLSYKAASQIFKKIRAVVNKQISAHSGRKTLGRQIYDSTKDLRLAQIALGHSSLQATHCYIGLDLEEFEQARNELGLII